MTLANLENAISRADIVRAHALIAPYIRATPVLRLEAGAAASVPVALKLEMLQHTGSFKVRGAFNTLLQEPVPLAGVAAASGGNHGAAVAYGAQVLGIGAQIFVPEISSRVKRARIEAYGAKITITGATYADALMACNAHVNASGAIAIHAYDAARTIAGQATLAREFEAQTGDLDTLLVAVGGGGLVGGALAWMGERTRIIAVEPKAAPTLARALAHGAPVDVEVGGLAADALGARRIGAIAFALARARQTQVLLLDDADIQAGQRWLWENTRLFAEPGGAAALAALISGAYVPSKGERVGVYVCGGNADPGSL